MNLKKLVGEKLNLIIITVDPKEKNLIFSQKGVDEKISDVEKPTKKVKKSGGNDMTKKYEIGDVLDSKVIGVVDFGIFVRLPAGDEGLIHISEISWSLIGDPKSLYSVGRWDNRKSDWN